MCEAFIEWAKAEGWEAYPETSGFDIVLVRPEDGCQIGVEAKQALNAKVLAQASSGARGRYSMDGPDHRAVLVPEGGNADLAELADLLGITVIRARDPKGWGTTKDYLFDPQLPRIDGGMDWELYQNRLWWDWCPPVRLKLPDYVPDCAAGTSSPLSLTHWKIRAIRVSILLERRGYVTPADFKALGISMPRWTQGGWLQKSEKRGRWIKGAMPDFKAQHPRNYDEIADDFENWKPAEAGPLI